MNLVATFPTPRPPPAGMALERAEPPPPVAPVGDGPFRTPGRLRVERTAGAVRIRLPDRRRTTARLAIGWATLMTVLGAIGETFVVPILLGLPAAVLAVAAGRRRSWIELTPGTVWVQDGGHLTLTLDRARITHIRCVCPNPTGVGPPDVPWEVWVTVDGQPVPLVSAGNLEHATAIAELLVHELGLPTWVPEGSLPGPRT